LNKNRAIALGLGFLALAVGAACDPPPPAGGATGIAGIDKFRVAGPNAVTQTRVGICTRFLPPQGAVDSRGGLGWANGTGGSPGTYTGILTRVASFGTLVSAANTAQSGRGTETAQCINELDAARSDSNGRFATAGHSQGGSGSINAARLNNKVVVTCPVQLDGTFTATSSPADLRGTRTGPALIMCGGADNLAPCTRAQNGDGKFNGATVPVTRISVIGAPHTGTNSPTGNGGLYAALVTTCVEAAVGGDAQASAALQPGGANGARAIDRVASRNF
jgi:dienelactone hydrolase